VSNKYDKHSNRLRCHLTGLKAWTCSAADYKARSGLGCTDGTRVQILDDINSWLYDPDAAHILWLSGMAGTGKTAIAWTVCSQADDNNKIILGGSFFCSRTTGSANQFDPKFVVPTLARSLALRSIEFSKALSAELARDPDVIDKHIRAQIQQLLYAPLLALENSDVPVLFVVDALDQCHDEFPANDLSNNAESHRIVAEMLSALAALSKANPKLPVKFLIVSRPEIYIRDVILAQAESIRVFQLDGVDKQLTTNDIRLYISDTLLAAPGLRSRFSSVDVEQLVGLSDGMFMVAVIAVRYILGAGVDVAVVRFRRMFDAARSNWVIDSVAVLDFIYHPIVLNALSMGHLRLTLDLRHILASIICSQMALSVGALADLLDIPIDELRASLSPFHSVIHVPVTDNQPSVRLVHSSFSNYLLVRAATEIRVSVVTGHEVLARACLRIMSKHLPVDSSQVFESNSLRPSQRLDTIALTLEYACTSWIFHITSIPTKSLRLEQKISAIFLPRLRSWLEVMSVLGCLQNAIAMLVQAAETVRLFSVRRRINILTPTCR